MREVRRHYSPEVKAQAVARYWNGDDRRTIAREAGITDPSLVSIWATETGRPPRARPNTNQKIAQ